MSRFGNDGQTVTVNCMLIDIDVKDMLFYKDGQAKLTQIGGNLKLFAWRVYRKHYFTY